MLRQAEHLLTVEETAVRLRQSPGTVRRKIREGQLPALRIGTGPRAPLRVNSVELERWLFEKDDSSPDPGNDSAERHAPDSGQVEAPAHSGEAA
jgi:excisionase family DNA binding protein